MRCTADLRRRAGEFPASDIDRMTAAQASEGTLPTRSSHLTPGIQRREAVVPVRFRSSVLHFHGLVSIEEGKHPRPRVISVLLSEYEWRRSMEVEAMAGLGVHGQLERC